MAKLGAFGHPFFYLSGVDEPVVMYETATTEPEDRQFYRAGPQGSIIAVTDNNGVAIATFSYDAYGNPDDPGGQPIRYTGRRWDAETGLYYYRARYYNPALGRFLQTDPIGYGDNVNLYAYTGNDPTNATDPTGNQGLKEAFGFLNNDRSETSHFSEVQPEIDQDFENDLENFKDAAIEAGITFAATAPMLADAGGADGVPGPDKTIAATAVGARFLPRVLRAGADDVSEFAGVNFRQAISDKIEQEIAGRFGMDYGSLEASTVQVTETEIAENAFANSIQARTKVPGAIAPKANPVTAGQVILEAVRVSVYAVAQVGRALTLPY